MSERLAVYFACSIRGEQGGKEEKELIVKTIQDLGHVVNSELFLEQDKDHNQLNAGFTPTEIYNQDIDLIWEANVMVADVTRVSMGVGFEIAWMLRNGRPVVALCLEDWLDSLSNMIRGCEEPGFSLHTWRGMEHPEDVREILERELGNTNG